MLAKDAVLFHPGAPVLGRPRKQGATLSAYIHVTTPMGGHVPTADQRHDEHVLREQRYELAEKSALLPNFEALVA